MNRHKLSCLCLIVLAVACSKDPESSEAPGASSGNEVPAGDPTRAAPAAMTDGEIAHVLATIDTGEIEQAQLAVTKATDPRVREFANHMIEQHTASKQQGAELATNAGIAPAPSAVAENLQAEATRALSQLQAAEGASFDALYMQSQVQQHQEALDTIEDKLVPAANHALLKERLTAAKAMVEHHLEQARGIQP